MTRKLAFGVAVLTILGLAATARAEDGILGSIEDFLSGTSESLDNNRLLGKIRLSPYLSQRAIYDDNIFLNDAHEPDTEGREWDVISDTTARLGLVLPVNKEYTKLFDRDRLTILSYEARFLEYLRRSDTDSLDQNIETDLFGFLSDLLNVGVTGNKIWFDAGASWKNLSDPLDLTLYNTRPNQWQSDLLALGQVAKIRRTNIDAHAGVGYRGNHFDAFMGYEFAWLDFSNDFFGQANHRMHSGIAEIGVNPPFMADKRFYARFRYSDLHFREELLNDAQIREYVAGVEGAIFTKKLRFDLSGGFIEWDTQSSGLSGDDHEYAGGVAHGRLLFKPWESRQTRFQFDGYREVNWSAIANYRIDHRFALTVFEELMPKKLDADATVAWSHAFPSEGEVRSLIEAGAGVTYHLLRQVDVTLRYLHRNQVGERENRLETSVVGSGGGVVSRVFETDGDFQQNVVSLGLSITF